MKLKRVGFFSELRHGFVGEPSLKDSVREKASEYEAPMLEYLRSGTALSIAPGVVTDALTKESKVIGGLSILTDGEWAWPSDLQYYLSKYHVQLPDEFVNRAMSSGWRIPEVKDVSTLEL